MDARNLRQVNGVHLPEPTLKVIGHLVVVDAFIDQHLVDVAGAQGVDHDLGSTPFRERCAKADVFIRQGFLRVRS